MPALPLEFVLFIVDILHLDLRVVPTLYFFGVTKELPNKAAALLHAGWMRKELGICLSRKYVKWNKGSTNLEKESLDGKACKEIVNQHVVVLKQVHKTEPATAEHMLALECFEAYRKVRDLLWLDFTGDGAAHALLVRDAATAFVSLFSASYGAEFVGMYMHALQDHVPQIIAQWGSLVKLCCQGSEMVHQSVKREGKGHSSRGGGVKVKKDGTKPREVVEQIMVGCKTSAVAMSELPDAKRRKKGGA
jgi:hypothetical protein